LTIVNQFIRPKVSTIKSELRKEQMGTRKIAVWHRKRKEVKQRFMKTLEEPHAMNK